MKVETMMKRIGTVEKDIAKLEREIARQYKEIEKTRKEAETDSRINFEFYKEWEEQNIAQNRKYIAHYEEKIAAMRKEAAKLATKEEQDRMVKAMAEKMAKDGFKDKGITTNGRVYIIYKNSYGWTERSLHCYSMHIEGMGTVFTSGTLETVAQYILLN